MTRCGRLLIRAVVEETIVGEEVTEESDMARGERKKKNYDVCLCSSDTIKEHAKN